MDKEDAWKDAITKNYAFFQSNISDPDDVAEYLYGGTTPSIITLNMKEMIQKKVTTSQKVGKMLQILLKCGPRVPMLLYEALIKTRHQHCAEALAPYLSEQEKTLQKQKKAKMTYLRPDDACCFLKYNSEDVYSMRRECRGLVFLINNEHFDSLPNREGTVPDRDSLTDLFRDLHFEVIVENDLTAQKIKENTRFISTCDRITNSDCFIFIILTHGDEKGVCGIDGISVPVATLTEMFEPNNCPELNEKPKIFLIQACRGDKKEMIVLKEDSKDDASVSNRRAYQMDKGNTTDVSEGNVPNASASVTVHSKSDFFIAYSTPEGSLSWRNKKTGSCFIQAIVWVFKKESHRSSLTEMMAKVNDVMSKDKISDDSNLRQYLTVSENRSFLRKTLYFFPGIYADKKVHPIC